VESQVSKIAKPFDCAQGRLWGTRRRVGAVPNRTEYVIWMSLESIVAAGLLGILAYSTVCFAMPTFVELVNKAGSNECKRLFSTIDYRN
jgi:hypothetical protein